jgi:ubiquinone/menaquinone biosynthesis C-methylase UbiE
MRRIMANKGCLAYVVLFLCVAFAPRASAQLASRTAEEWINTLETPARIQSLKIYETIGKLALKPGQIVADIGAGTGIFTLRFASSVKPGGKIYAVEVDEKLLEHIAEAATEQGLVNVEGVLGEYDDPSLPGEIDLAFINDVLHHIEHRDVYLKNLAGYLKPAGRVAIIEFKPGQGGHTTQPELQVSQEQATTWMAAAGLKPVEAFNDLFPDKWFVIYAKP